VLQTNPLVLGEFVVPWENVSGCGMLSMLMASWVVLQMLVRTLRTLGVLGRRAREPDGEPQVGKRLRVGDDGGEAWRVACEAVGALTPTQRQMLIVQLQAVGDNTVRRLNHRSGLPNPI
jgi:hypothetical protein